MPGMFNKPSLQRDPFPTITVFRKISGAGNRCWFYAGGQPHQMSEALAIKEAEQGKIHLKTIDNA